MVAPDRARRLGRGLDFLLSSADPKRGSTEQVELELERVKSNPWQPRTSFDEEALEALSDSIRQHGVIQPVSVRRRGEGYELIAGERRVLAAKRAGLQRIPAIVREVDDSQMLLVALVENVQRADLNPLERARALRRIVAEHGKSHDDVARMAGMGRSTVSNSIRLLELDPESLDALESGRISEGHARALLSEPDLGRRRALLKSVLNDNINVRNLEIASKKGTVPSAPTGPSADARRLAGLLGEKLGTKVRIIERGARGRIVIDYPTLKDFERIFGLLAGHAPPVD